MSMFKLRSQKERGAGAEITTWGKNTICLKQKVRENNLLAFERDAEEDADENRPQLCNFPLSTKLDFKDASKENKSPSFKDNKSITDGG